MSSSGLSSALNNLAFALRDYAESPSFPPARTKIEQKYGALSSEYSRAIAIIRREFPKDYENLKETVEAIKSLQNALISEDDKYTRKGLIQRFHQLGTEVHQVFEMIENKERSKNPESADLLSKDEVFRLKKEITNLKKQSKFEKLIESANKVDLPLNWVMGTIYVSILEAYVKKWLHSQGEELEKLKNKRFHELIGMMESVLKKKNIRFEQKKLSDMAGRLFRNKVLHEHYVPTDNELEEVIKENSEFINYFNSLKS